MENNALQNNTTADVGERQGHQVIAGRVEINQFSGPLPHPDILARYNEIVPGAADRIRVLLSMVRRAEEKN